jgi:hypothetical protein
LYFSRFQIQQTEDKIPEVIGSWRCVIVICCEVLIYRVPLQMMATKRTARHQQVLETSSVAL